MAHGGVREGAGRQRESVRLVLPISYAEKLERLAHLLGVHAHASHSSSRDEMEVRIVRNLIDAAHAQMERERDYVDVDVPATEGVDW